MNYKICVANEAESKEVQELFVALGGEVRLDDRVGFVCLTEGKIYTDDIKFYDDYGDCKEPTIPQLRDMVVLKRNMISDATHENTVKQKLLKASSGWYIFNTLLDVWEWYGGSLKEHEFVLWQRETQSEALPFIDDEPKYDPEDIGIAKDYDLDELAKEYKLRDRCDGETDEEYRYMLKHRIDLESYIAKETLNDKVASAEVARQEFIGAPFSDLPEVNFEAVDDFVESNVEQDNVNQPSHYNKGGVECIDAIQSSMTHEAFCGYLKGNIQKYIFRYEDKGGLESLLKAQWYLNKMIGIIECSKVKNSED